MNSPYPLALEPIVDDLERLSVSELKRLAAKSSVPFGTIYRIRLGYTDNPLIKTLTGLAPHLHKMVAKKQAKAATTA